jgi:hypothetical protein
MKTLKNTLGKFTAIIISLFIINSVNATVYTTVASGSWNSTSVWSPSKPYYCWGFNDTVVINHNITLSSNLYVYGKLTISQNGSLTSTNKSLVLREYGVLTVDGTLEVKNLTGDLGQTDIINNGTMTVHGYLKNYEGNFTNNASLSVTKGLINDWDSYFVNSSAGTIAVDGYFTNNENFTNNGNITVAKKFTNSWNSIMVNTGTIQISKEFKNQGSLTNSGAIISGNKFVNDWGSTFNNSGNFTVNNKFENRGAVTNSGTITSADLFKNKGSLTNTNTVNINDDFSNDWGTTVNNTGVINVLYDLNNYGSIVNDGGLIVDGSANSNSGTISGTGNLCNSDGVTDPTGGSKGVSCPICVGEQGNLPVEMVEFKAAFNGSAVIISWTTVAEINNERFEVLRSVDGVDFQMVGTVAGNGNSNIKINYDFTDNSPVSGVVYYALRQVDYDGTSVLSKIIEVNVDTENDAMVYPNPVNGGSDLNIETHNNTEKVVEIYNVAGSKVRSFNSCDSHIVLNTDGIERGVYIVRIIWNTNIISKKIQVN